MWCVSIGMFRLSSVLLIVLGVTVDTEYGDRQDPDETDQCDKERPYNEFLCHSRVSFERWIRHG